MFKFLIAATVVIGAVVLAGQKGMPQVHGGSGGGKILTGGSVVGTVAAGVGGAARRLRN